MLESGEFRN